MTITCQCAKINAGKINQIQLNLLHLLLSTSHCRQCPSQDDHCATYGLPTTSICSKAVKNSQRLTEKTGEKNLLAITWKSVLTKAKFSSTALSQDHLLTYGWMEKRWKKCIFLTEFYSLLTSFATIPHSILITGDFHMHVYDSSDSCALAFSKLLSPTLFNKSWFETPKHINNHTTDSNWSCQLSVHD